MKRAMYLLPALVFAASAACSSSGTGTATITRSAEPTQAAPFDTNEPALNPDQPLANPDQPLPNSDQPPPNPNQPTAQGQPAASAAVTCTQTCVGLSGHCAERCNTFCVTCLASPQNCLSNLSELFRECLGQKNPIDIGSGGAFGIGFGGASGTGIGGSGAIGVPNIDAGGL